MEPASDNPPPRASRLRRLIRALRNLTALGLLTLSFGVLALSVLSYVSKVEVSAGFGTLHLFGVYELAELELAFALVAFALKPKPRLRFSLSDLLVLITFVAVLFAGAAGLSRLGS